MSTEQLVTVLEDIRDQQKRQLENYERAMQVQDESALLQKRAQKTLTVLIIVPWLTVISMFLFLFLRSWTG